jgi:hypothetical protein
MSNIEEGDSLSVLIDPTEKMKISEPPQSQISQVAILFLKNENHQIMTNLKFKSQTPPVITCQCMSCMQF